MKKNALYFLLLIGIGSLGSCKKEKSTKVDEPQIRNVNVLLSGSAGFTYDMGFFGDEEESSIAVQAQHYATSYIERYDQNAPVIYHYTPETGYKGPDYVELKSAKGAGGAGSSKQVNIIRIKFDLQ